MPGCMTSPISTSRLTVGGQATKRLRHYSVTLGLPLVSYWCVWSSNTKLLFPPLDCDIQHSYDSVRADASS